MTNKNDYIQHSPRVDPSSSCIFNYNVIFKTIFKQKYIYFIDQLLNIANEDI